MAATIVQTKTAAVNTGDASPDPAFDVAPTSGNVVVLMVGSDDYDTGVPDGFTQSTGCAQETFLGCYLWWLVSDGSNTFTYEIGSASPSCWMLVEISGLDATPYDTSNGQFVQSSSTSITTPAITPSTGERFLLALVGFSSSNAFTAPPNGVGSWLNSFTEITEICTVLGSGTRDQIGVAYREVTGDGSTTFSSGATSSGSGTPQSRVGIIIAFEVGGGTGATVTPSTVAATAAVPSATVSAGSTLAPAAVAAVASVPSATVQIHSTITPSTVAAAAATPSAAVSVGSTLAPTAVAAAAAVPSVAVSTGVTLAPATVAADSAVPDPAVSAGGSVTITPSTVAAVAAVPSATASAGATVTAVTVTATAAAPSATLATGVTLAAATVAAVAAVNSAALSTGSTVTASTVAAVCVAPASATATGSTVTATAVAAVAAVPSASVSTGGSTLVTPSTVTIVATIPAVTVSAEQSEPRHPFPGKRQRGVRARDTLRPTPTFANRRRRR